MTENSRVSFVRNLPAIVGVSPFESPDARLVCALARAGALGVLDLGHDALRARDALSVVSRLAPTFGVRIAEHFDGGDVDLPAGARVVLVPASLRRFAWGERAVLAQVTSVDEARLALASGADGLVVKGHEAAGVVSDETSFVLLQRVLAETRAPVWVQGGIGLHTGAACVAAGARGVVLDTQLALLEEASTCDALRAALATMDGSETAITAGYRLYARPNARRPDPGAAAADIARALGSGDPARELVALGQDAAFARPLADRFATVKRLVRAIEIAFDGHARHACSLQPLARHAPLARALGTEFPIAQGPMTRVSDRASFADAVAKAGGLPFLALSLMRGAEARTLLEETRELLGSRPWGVGILGFVPADLREEQLALVREVRPPFALLAGGRPSQAEPLESVGIPTFLHVPSPALLDMFLKEGARRFVLEGLECGGHVGPRSSFVLWDAAVTRLLACDRLDDVSVLFAGGVHDGVSARMVATLAAPLAARGAKVGVLMGTAYLFTEEAVARGAIKTAFQEAALGCTGTALLETAPGHKTRCAATEYVRAFEDERIRLESEGCDAKTTWAHLEQMNLGRLRVAAKALRRDGSRLVEVSEKEQRREGLFMIGQVAALRDARCTIAELHRAVSDGSTCDVASAAAPPTTGEGARPVDIAIVGIACIYPDAPDAPTFWSNVVLGKSSIREVPRERWNPDLYFDPRGTGDKTPSKWGAFVAPTVIDPGAYGIPPRSLASIDPVQMLSLEVARRALDDAGYAEKPFDRERASVIFGAEAGADLTSAYGFRASFAQYFADMPPELDACLPKLTEDSFPGVLSNVIAGRIANRLDLRGANYTVDAACASSLAAVDVACKELVTGSSDLVVAGGADLHNGIYDYLMFASVHALSPTGQCRPFDAHADGIALGEGVAAVVLKRLADAERDGDRVYAVLKGVGSSSDGRSLGLTAPRKEGQLRALERAYESARISPADIGLVEAHGTGTVVGDRTELATLTEFFGAAGAAAGSCTLGSVKGQIGHTKCAAGMAGLIKAALALHTGVLPPTKNVETPNPGFDAKVSPFVLRDGARPWMDDSRMAAVSAFGFGGTNFHAVLASHATPSASGLVAWPAELFVLRAKDDAQLDELLALLESATRADVPPALRDLAASVHAAHGEHPIRLAIVASSLADLGAKTAAARERRAAQGVHVVAPIAGDVAFLFPGQGSQKPGMLAELFVAFPELRALLSVASSWTDRLYPGGAFTPEERTAQQRALADTRVAQPLLGVVDLAMARLLERLRVRPAMLAGHSYGELVALAVGGAFDAPTLFALSELRARSILDVCGGAPGTMAAVRGSAERVRAVLGDEASVVLANDNAPDQVVIAGSEEAVARACERLGREGLAARSIPVACAFHSPIVARATEAFAAHLAKVEVRPPCIPVYANATAAPHERDPNDIRRTLASQIALPVRFVEQIQAMYAAGARVFVEAGPGGVLTDLVGRILDEREHVAIACDVGGSSGLAALLSAVARMIAAGVDVDVTPFFTGRASSYDLAELCQRHRASPTAWVVDGRGARPLHGDLPDFAMRPPEKPIAVATEPDRDRQVREYLRSMREVVEQQRQVMLAYLGDGEMRLPVRGESVPAPTLGPIARAAPPTAAPEHGSHVTPLEALVAIVTERTGYPAHMLDPNLDLEADLGIDSIKRIEIVGALRDRLHLAANGDATKGILDELATVKTLSGMAALLEARIGRANGAEHEKPNGHAASGARSPNGGHPPHASNGSSGSHGPIGSSGVGGKPRAGEPPPIRRYVLELARVPSPAPGGASIAGKWFAITPDRKGVAATLAGLLERHGARARLIAPGDHLGKTDGLVHLETIAGDSLAVRSLFSRAKEAAIGDAQWIVAGTGLGGRFGRDARAKTGTQSQGGVSGLLKSLAKERPTTRVRVVDLDPDEPAETLAHNLFQELVTSDVHLEVGYSGGERHTLVASPRPARDDMRPPLEIDERSAILVTGGARGITGRIALAMARRFRCALELVGRSAAPDTDEDPEIARASDAREIRRLLASRSEKGSALALAAIDRECRAILAAREIRATLGAIRDAGATATYHAVDVSDAAAFGALVERLRARHGRIDGVVHGAGLIEDKLIADKTADSFDRVFATKVAGANVLADKLAHDARFFVLFSSIAGTFGSRGQTDYAAANEALDKLAHELHRTVRGRVLSIGWGPWRDVGMVSPDLQREYERRGIALIAPEAGVERFLEELFSGSEPQVILTAAPAEVLA
jgi:acyl transferase domain-containing protein/NAD(P)H-dependent flavin oxidoreductase YrpB (nitropropane dioxygenase family)/acyl carrier protein